MVASELPENFNAAFKGQNHKISILTPMYLGNTGKKKAVFDGKVYQGAENKSVDVEKIGAYTVPFLNRHGTLTDHEVKDRKSVV